jgi:hypothetical protein
MFSSIMLLDTFVQHTNSNLLDVDNAILDRRENRKSKIRS